MKTILWPTTAGAEALRRLSLDRLASVLGETSRGLFLRLAADEVMFLSREEWRGPLSINVPDLATLSLEPGDAAEVRDGRVIFPQRALAVELGRAQAWQARPAELSATRPRTLERLKQAAQPLLAEKDGAGMSGSLAELLDLPFEVDALADLCDPVQPACDALRQQDVPAAVEHLGRLLGCGSGLTPSGDDFLLGLLLAGSVVGRSTQAALADQLIPLAYASTTTLSANLIACAVAGQADERLTATLAGLVGNVFDCERTVQGLSEWGNSSGLDALTGMAAWFLNTDW